MVAHASGLDDVLIAVAIVGAYLVYAGSRKGRGGRRQRFDPGKCLYCGSPLGTGPNRCPECGFRASKG